MGSKQANLVGIKFNMLQVVKQAPSRQYGKTKKRMWECICDCGKTIILNTGCLTTGSTSSCGCNKYWHNAQTSRTTRHKIAKHDAGYRSIYNSYIANSRARNLTFDISFNEFIMLVTSECYYCGIEPSNTYMKSYYNIKYNGIDRVDNKVGYTPSNIVTCCKICNIAKNNHTHEEFKNWIMRLIKKHQQL